MGKRVTGIGRTRSLVEKLLKKNNLERLQYLKLLNPKELNLLSEITLNIIRGTVKISKKTKTILGRVRKTLYKLASKSVKSEIKKKLWINLKGLHILNILLPIIHHEILLSD